MIRCVVSKELVVKNENAVEILNLMRSGFRVSFQEPEAKSGVPTVKVQRIRRKRRRAPNVTAEQLRQMLELRKKGMTHRIIARRFGLSLSGAANAMRRAEKGAKA